MRITPVTAPSNYKGITNTGYSKNLAYNKQSKTQMKKNDDVYIRLADASTRDMKIFNELKSMGLI